MNADEATITIPYKTYLVLEAKAKDFDGKCISISVGGYYNKWIEILNESEIITLLRNDIKNREDERMKLLEIIRKAEDIYGFDIIYPLDKELTIKKRTKSIFK